MPTSFIKAIILTIAAMLFSLGQACTCLQIQHGDHTHQTSPAHQVSSAMGERDHAAETKHHTHFNQRGDGLCENGECPNTCYHCHQDQMFASSISDLEPPYVVSTLQPDISPSTQTTYARTSFAPRALAGLRWLDPPRNLSTPTSLNTRLLI